LWIELGAWVSCGHFVDLDELLCDRSIALRQVNTTGHAAQAMVFDTLGACERVTFPGIHPNGR
jgi:hypothetical protein